jgi:glutaredoxin 3
MSRVVMYSTGACPYCVRAKALLNRKGVEIDEIRIEGSHDLMEEMIQRSRRRTVPQIFIGERHVGGCDDLYELDAEGRLDPLLGIAPVELDQVT